MAITSLLLIVCSKLTILLPFEVNNLLITLKKGFNNVRAIHIPTEEVKTIAGTMGNSDNVDGELLAASFHPISIAKYKSFLYVCDSTLFYFIFLLNIIIYDC